jgi:hypothetical protein
MVVAIVLIGLVATASAVLAIDFAAQARRTQSFAEDAQLRQLLLAGAQAAPRQLQAGTPPERKSISLPDLLIEQGGVLTLQTLPAASPDEKLVRIEASLPRRHLAQDLRFTKRDGSWRIAAAELGE